MKRYVELEQRHRGIRRIVHMCKGKKHGKCFLCTQRINTPLSIITFICGLLEPQFPKTPLTMHAARHRVVIITLAFNTTTLSIYDAMLVR